MKGVVFLELLTMAENAFGEDVVDQAIDTADLESGGACTAIGNCPCEELVRIVEAFSAHSGLGPDVLQRKFGPWMMEFFGKHSPGFFEGKTTSFEVREAVGQEIHVEVWKLHLDAARPRFDTQRPEEGTPEILYSVPRPLVSFCHGLNEACVDRFGETAEVAFDATPQHDDSTTFRIDLADSRGQAFGTPTGRSRIAQPL